MYKTVVFIFLILLSTNIYSQEDKVKVTISNEQVILDQDTLLIGITKLLDILGKAQIDSLGSPCEVQWDGDCDSGMYYDHIIKKKFCDLGFISQTNVEYFLETFIIKNMDSISLSIEDRLIENRLTHEELLNLGFVKNDQYQVRENEVQYLKKGIHVNVVNENNYLLIKSINIHPKSWDKCLDMTNLKGKVRDGKGELLPGVLLMAYNDLDSLKYYTVTDIDGYFNFDVKNVSELEILNFNCQLQTIRVTEEKQKAFDISLDFQRYALPDLLVSKRRGFEYDTLCFRKQFPQARDSMKINVWLFCEYQNFNPLFYSIPQPLNGYHYMYSELVRELHNERRVRNCEAEVFFEIKKDGSVCIERIEGAEQINKEHLACSMKHAFKFKPLTWRRRRCNTYWKLRVIFE